jgi:predicted ATP-grasp superfamily ATP-dependent carboligase
LQASAPAIVLDGNQRSALSTVRSLGRQGIVVSVGETQRRSLAASSRYCRAALAYPDPAQCPEQFCRWLEQINGAFPGAVLLPMTDVTVPLVLRSTPRLPTLRIALPSLDLYEAVSDKYRLFQLARAAGVRVPETVPVSRAALGRLEGRDWRYPLVIKPRKSTMRLDSGTRKRSVRYAADRGELVRTVESMLIDATDELLIQEYVSGEGAGVFGLYEYGRPRLFFAHRRIREKPPSGGTSVLCESVRPPAEGLAAARGLLDSLGWHGVAMVEFKIDESGHMWLIEINARFWGSLQLAVDCGADFPWFLYQIAAGASPEVPADYSIGNRLRWWLGDLDNLYARLRDSRWTPTVLDKARAVGEFLKPWQPRTRYELLRWNDPAPSIMALRQYLAALGRKRRATQ